MPNPTPTPSPSSLITAGLAQLIGLILAATCQQILPGITWTSLEFAAMQGIWAALAGYKLDAPPWWLPIHGSFAPLITLATRLPIPPAAYLIAFLLLLSIFWRTDKSRVPLFLTSSRGSQALTSLLPPHPIRFIDLGCGNGRVLKALAIQRPECTFIGIEHAPIPWLIAQISTSKYSNITILHGNFWQHSLADYDIVYCFLSPAPMASLWKKPIEKCPPKGF